MVTLMRILTPLLLFLFLFCDSFVFASDTDPYFKAAEAGDAEAQEILGWLFQGNGDVARDYKKSIYWYSKSAEQGYASAQNRLGVMYDNGLGVTQDHEKAVYWYSRSAEQGNIVAQTNLGVMYATGIGVIKDNVQAFKWWRIASENGDEKARTNVTLVAKDMTSEQIAEAQRMAREWMDSHQENSNGE